MTKLLVERPNGTRVATVVQTTRAKYEIETVDEEIRRVIEEALARSESQGLPLHQCRRERTEGGTRYQRVARRLLPGEVDFLQALGDYLARYNLFAYPVESGGKGRPHSVKASPHS